MKIFLIFAGIFAALMILAIIIAVSRPSFNERRKGGGSQTPSNPKTKKRSWPSVIVIILLGLAVIVGAKMIKGYSSASYLIAADAQNIWPRVGETVKVKIYPDRLSGWINLPKGVNFMIDAPGEIEYFFWSGKRILIKDKNTKWLKPQEVTDCSFRLRGTVSEASITVQ